MIISHIQKKTILDIQNKREHTFILDICSHVFISDIRKSRVILDIRNKVFQIAEKMYSVMDIQNTLTHYRYHILDI